MNETTNVVLLFDAPPPAPFVSRPALVSDAALFILLPAALALLSLLLVALLSRRRKASGRALAPLHRVGSVTEPLAPEGAVVVGGELWRARTRDGAHVPRGRANVRVVGARGHLLEVERVGRSTFES